MERFTISLDEALASQFDQLIAARGYSNRSEAVRDLIRTKLEAERLQAPAPDGFCIGSLTYIYNHHERDLAERLFPLGPPYTKFTAVPFHVCFGHLQKVRSDGFSFCDDFVRSLDEGRPTDGK